MKTFVLGGAGFVGMRTVAALVAAGHQVTSLVRSPASAAALERLGSRTVRGDVVAGGAFVDEMRGSDVVISFAFPSFLGRMTRGRSRRVAREALTVVEGVLRAVKAAGNPPLVISEGTMGFGDTGGRTADESWPYAFDCGHGRLLELTVPRFERAVAEDGLRLTKVLVGGAYGPGSWFRENVYTMAKRGMLGVFGDGASEASMAHVDDVAELVRLAAEAHPPGESFIAVDDAPCTVRELSDFVNALLGRPPGRALPKWLGTLFLGAVGLEALTMNVKCTSAKARRVLGWKLRYPSFREGIPPVIAELEGATRAGTQGLSAPPAHADVAGQSQR